MGGPDGYDGANYGTKGVASVLNYPGSRGGHTAALHPLSNSMLIFGGYQIGSTGGFLNDVWSIPLNFSINESIPAKITSKCNHDSIEC